MSTILVEARRDPANGPALDRIATVCHAAGHDTFRWRGPLSGRVPYWRRLFVCDLAILWNGAHPRYERTVAKLKARGTQILHVELGWNPQRGTIQIDPQGTNARASWAAERLASLSRTPVATRTHGDLLVVLQLDRDTQITQLSPYFRDMRSFVEFISRHSELPVRVRAHPRATLGRAAHGCSDAKESGVSANAQSLAWALGLSGVTWDDSPSLAAALTAAKAVATINSSCGVEALAAGLPVLCYGESIYRHPGAVYCLTDDPQATRAATAELAAGKCRCYCEPIAELLSRIAEHQWPVEAIPERLPRLLNRMLPGGTTEPAPPSNRWITRITRFARDLPPRLLPRLAAR
jgi:hypothetical protein